MNNSQSNFLIREATQKDAENIGELHALSWQTAYRGLLSDHYLDNNLESERKKYWSKKFTLLTSKEFVLVVENENKILGFAALLDRPEKGYEAFIDNLHVRPELKGKGIGKKLMKAVADRLIKTGRESAYLWVLKGNTSAEKFYEVIGGQAEDQMKIEFGGTTVSQTRFVWKKLDALLR